MSKYVRIVAGSLIVLVLLGACNDQGKEATKVRLAEQQQTISELQSKLTDAESRTTDLEANISENSRARVEQEQAIVDLKSKLVDAGSHVGELEASLTEESKVRSDHERTIADLQAKLAGAESRSRELEATLAEGSKARAEQARAITDLRGKLAETESQAKQQSAEFAGLQATVERLSARPFKHEGLFYDRSHIERVKANSNAEPWRSALAGLKARADAYLTFIPQPIRTPWSVPSPFDDPDTQDALVKPLEESSNAMLALAQYFLFSGDETYARKAASIATAWTGSLKALGNTQAVYQAGWEMLVMAMAASMLDDYAGWDKVERESFNKWLNERTWHMIARDDAGNNHKYWLAAQSAAVGVLTDDPGLYKWAVTVYKRAITFDMASDGHMPQESARGELGMFYQNFALEPLTIIAEIAMQQGEDLWGFRSENRDIKLAIDYLFTFFDRPEDWPWSRSRQDLSFLDPVLGGKKTGWFELVYYRYRDQEIAEYLLDQRPVFDRRSGGMTTLTHGLPLE